MLINPPIQISFFQADFITPIIVPMDNDFISINVKQAYLNPTTDFSITFCTEQSNLQNYSKSLDIRAKVFINSNPICAGYLYNTDRISSKGQGTQITYHFKSLCGLLDQIKIAPTTSFTGQETLEIITQSVLSTSVIPFFPSIIWNIFDDSSQISYRKAGSISTYAQTHHLKKQNSLKDIQPTVGESVYSFLQKLYHRTGCHLRDACDSAGNPILIIDAPNTSVKFSGQPINVTQSFSTPNTIKVQDVKEFIKNDIPSFFLTWSHSFGNSMSATFQSAPIVQLIISPIAKTNPVLAAQLPTILAQNFSPQEEDQFLEQNGTSTQHQSKISSATKSLDDFIGPFLYKFTNSMILPEYKYEMDCVTEDQLHAKTYSRMCLSIFNGYTLDYTLLNQSSSDIFYYPDQIVTIKDDVTFNTNTAFNDTVDMWISAVDTSYSKSSGLVQKVTLKIPGSVAFEENLGP
jgi:hypothetical protein